MFGVLLGVALLAAFDLWGPVRTDIRVFDPVLVARLDTDTWRSYYDRRPARLFMQLAELMRDEFHFPLLRSYVAAAHSARAAFEFKYGRARRDYERALPELTAYFAMLRRVSVSPFDVRRASDLELEWWIVHRSRPDTPQAELERALANAASALYGVPASLLGTYAHERAEAMTIRDTGEADGSLGEHDWDEIARHLRAAWGALAKVVRPSTPAEPVATAVEARSHVAGAGATRRQRDTGILAARSSSPVRSATK